MKSTSIQPQARPTANTTIGAIVALLLAACGDDPRVNGPYLQTVTTDTVVISWETSTAQASVLEWGLTSDYGMLTQGEGASTFHRLALTGLTPATEYHYRVVASGIAGTDHTFTTAPVDATALRFAVYGDSQDNAEMHTQISNAVLASQPAFVLHVGDTVQHGQDQAAWHDQFFGPASELLANVPVYATMGNHEENASWYYYYHAYEGGESWYSFAYGPAFVITLDVNKDFEPGSRQYDWLVETLSSKAAQNAPWLFVTYHMPGYTDGWQDCSYDGKRTVREYLMPLMEAYGVDVVFNGHMHGYERGTVNGVQYVLSGGGGGELDKHCKDWSSIEVSEYLHNYLTVEIDGASLRLQAHKVNGDVFDEIALDK